MDKVREDTDSRGKADNSPTSGLSDAHFPGWHYVRHRKER